jgi:hypothetical protein
MYQKLKNLELKFKKQLRRFALDLKYATDRWVVPSDMLAVDLFELTDEQRQDYRNKLDEFEKIWPNDPELIYLSSLLHFSETLD